MTKMWTEEVIPYNTIPGFAYDKIYDATRSMVTERQTMLNETNRLFSQPWMGGLAFGKDYANLTNWRLVMR
jgi:hypothetical protein